VGLVNLWRVAGAEGEAADTWLRLDARQFQLWRDCGMITGSWTASAGLFLAAPWGTMGDCATGSMPVVPWLERASGYVATPGGFDLVDASGHALAVLTIDGAPDPIATAAEFYAQAPQITPETTKAFRTPSALATGLTAATAEALLGTWVPVAYAVKTNPHVTFTADGRWTGSDGCNDGGGRFAVGGGGMLLSTAGPSTLIGCEGAPVPTWVAQATSAGFDKDWLLLFDLDGNEIGRLDRG
jgi:heat shock protein HslJ